MIRALIRAENCLLHPDFSVTADIWKRAIGLLLEELKYASLDPVQGREAKTGQQGGEYKKSHVPDIDQQCPTTDSGANFGTHIDLCRHQR